MLPEHVLDEILISEVVAGLRVGDKVPADASDVDGTNSVNQGLVQLQLAIGEAFPERMPMVQPVKDGWLRYKMRKGSFGAVMREAIGVIPDLFRGLKRSDVQALASRVAENEASMTYAFPRKVYGLMRERKPGHRRLLVAITGSPHDYAVPFCKALGFDAAVGCWMEVDAQGRYTGRRDERPAIDKGPVMDELTEKRGLDWEGGTAFGDSPTDIPLFVRCTYRLAINPTMDLQRYMRAHPDQKIVWVNDHQKTGTQLLVPNEFGQYRECDACDVLPWDLTQAVRNMPGLWSPC